MARLPQGVRRRENGSYEKRITINGKRYSIYAGSTRELQDKEDLLREDIKNGLYVSNRDITLAKYFDEWISSRSGTMKASSENVFISTFNTHFRDVLGGRKVREIERREIVAVQKQLAEHLNPNTVNDRMTLLKSVFESARIDGIIVRNPCEGIKRLKADSIKASDTIHRSLTETEIEAFLGAQKGEWLYPFYLFSFSTGMRIMEISALTWADIDFKKSIIHVRKNYEKVGGDYILSTPKSKTSKRDIPITEPIRAALAQQKKNNLMLFGGGQLKPDAHVFVSIRGGLMLSASIAGNITTTLAKLEKSGVHIERFTHHCCRDTFATMYLRGGGNLQTLKTILGHSSLAMTADLYAHVLEDTKQEEMDRVAAIFTRAAGA